MSEESTVEGSSSLRNVKEAKFAVIFFQNLCNQFPNINVKRN